MLTAAASITSKLRADLTYFRRRTSLILRMGNLLFPIEPPYQRFYGSRCPASQLLLSHHPGGQFPPRYWPTLLRQGGQFSPENAAGARAARSHTAALTGEDAIYDSAFKQAGVIRVDEIREMSDIAAALLRQPLPRGKRVGILSAGGHAVVASDACLRAGLEVTSLSQATIEELNQLPGLTR